MAADIAAAFTALKYIRDFTKWVLDMRQDAEVLSRVNEAMRATGEVQDKLQELREENLRLLEERRQLSDKLREVEDWQKRRAAYQLTGALRLPELRRVETRTAPAPEAPERPLPLSIMRNRVSGQPAEDSTSEREDRQQPLQVSQMALN